MATKIRIGLLFGGQSAEHEVSIASARAIYGAIDPGRYEAFLVCIGRDGVWRLLEARPGGDWPADTKGASVLLARADESVVLIFDQPPYGHACTLDVVFPILHGPNGEDGTVQGLLQTYGVAYVGASVLGSAIGMDKDLMKRLLLQAGLPTAKGLVLNKSDRASDAYERCVETLGRPLFLKPANTGSSVGISKVSNRSDFEAALDLAFAFDRKVVVEEFIDGREIECGVLGSANPRISTIGEITTTHEFYSYQAKYQDEAATSLIIPADIPEEVADRLKALALQAYKALCCEGMARMDFFLGNEEELWINEINTIPGFTRHSMYPLLWAHSGVSFPQLVEVLVSDGLNRHQQRIALRRNR